MLRITISKSKHHRKYVLEGRLAGDWAQELVWVTRELCPGAKAVVDIEHVHYVDALGEKALHWLSRLGAAFVVRNAYGVDLCQRLELRRLGTAESETQAPKAKGTDAALSAPVRLSRMRSSRDKGRH